MNNEILNNEVNFITKMPLELLGVIVLLFLILMNSLSLLNLLIFLVSYIVLTRVYYPSAYDEDSEE